MSETFIDRDAAQIMRENPEGLLTRMYITGDEMLEVYTDCGHGPGNLILRIPAARVAELFSEV